MSIAAALDHMISGRYGRDSRYRPEGSTGCDVPTVRERGRDSRYTPGGTDPEEAAVPTVPTGISGSRYRLDPEQTQQRRGILVAVPTVPTVPTVPAEFQHVDACTAKGDPIAEARRCGWRVEVRPAGLLVDTCGRSIDPALMGALFNTMRADERSVQEAGRWPADVLADPGEVVLRGDLERIERESGR